MTMVISEENPWLADEPLELLDSQIDDSYEKKPSAFFLKSQAASFSPTYREKFQKNVICQSSEISTLTDQLEEWTSPKPKLIDFLLTNEQLQESRHREGVLMVRLSHESIAFSEEVIIDALKTYAKTYLRSYARSCYLRNLAKPQKRFTLTSLEKGDLQQDQEEAYIEKQAELFDACKRELLENYEGSYILFEDGHVLDIGESRSELAMRAYEKYGMKPLFIERVMSESETLPAVWTPFPLA
jgi:hypothetical protein